MAPTKRIMSAVQSLLVCSVSASVFLVQPSVAAGQTTLESCLATAAPAAAAIGALRNFRFSDVDVIDRGDVQEGIDSAIQSLADNVLSSPGTPSRLEALCGRLAVAAASSEPFLTGDDCATADSLTCEGEVLFGNYQDAVEALGEDAVPRISSASKIAEVRAIVRQVYTAVRLLVELVIAEARTAASLGSGGSSSDSPAIVDALQNQQIAEGQAASCLDTSSTACGNAVGSFFDAFLNAIIEIIE
jgi:hypothetical protein